MTTDTSLGGGVMFLCYCQVDNKRRLLQSPSVFCSCRRRRVARLSPNRKQRAMLAMNLLGILFFAIVFTASSASSSLQGVSLKNLKQLLRNPSFEHTWRPKGSGDGSAFTLSGTNLDDWQSFRVGHAPLAKPFILTLV